MGCDDNYNDAKRVTAETLFKNQHQL